MKASQLIFNMLAVIMLKKIFKWCLIVCYIYLFNLLLIKLERFVENNFAVLDIDSIADSRPISMDEDEVNTPNEIAVLSDALAYGKVREI
jgi:hypothetical protein